MVKIKEKKSMRKNEKTYLHLAIKDNTKSKDETSTIAQTIPFWLETLKENTKRNYKAGMNGLVKREFISLGMTIKDFNLVDHTYTLDQIKQVEEWSECSKQARVACYISFTSFLNERFECFLRRAIPNRQADNKTFFRVHKKIKTQAMSKTQWMLFLHHLEMINPRDCLMAKILLQGGKRVSEILALNTSQIDWQKNEITFSQAKMHSIAMETIITYPDVIMDRLKNYLEGREGIVFITDMGKPILRQQLADTFCKAGQLAEIPFKITPQVLRASAITYFKEQGFTDSDIMKVTGHTSAEMIYTYDKSLKANNASKKISLIS